MKKKTNKEIENNIPIKEDGNGKKCTEEILAILKKYNCQLICEMKIIYGQRVFVPIVDELPEIKK